LPQSLILYGISDDILKEFEARKEHNDVEDGVT